MWWGGELLKTNCIKKGDLEEFAVLSSWASPVLKGWSQLPNHLLWVIILVPALKKIKVPEAMHRRKIVYLSCPISTGHHIHCVASEIFLSFVKWCESFQHFSLRVHGTCICSLILAVWVVWLGIWRGMRPWTSSEQRGNNCSRGGLCPLSKEVPLRWSSKSCHSAYLTYQV